VWHVWITTDNPPRPAHGAPTLPASARLSLNRCNLPAAILGGLTYQAHPVPLELDGIHALYADLFAALADTGSHAERARRFLEYRTVHFRLEHLEEAGRDPRRIAEDTSLERMLWLPSGTCGIWKVSSKSCGGTPCAPAREISCRASCWRSGAALSTPRANAGRIPALPEAA